MTLLPKDGNYFLSADLSSATDRFPLDNICQVMEGFLPTWYIGSWKYLMSGLPFMVPHQVKNTSSFKGTRQESVKRNGVSYKVGNPMGFYSSWASFALAHHFVVFLACYKCGVSWSKLPYALLGDDIVIAHEAVGEAYLQLMNELGVEVSIAKTHKSNTTYEFAKRWVHKGVEISPFPIAAMKEEGTTFIGLTHLLYSTTLKGWLIDDIPSLTGGYLAKIGRLPGRVRRHGLIMSKAIILYRRFLDESITADDLWNGLSGIHGVSSRVLPSYFNIKIREILYNMFLKSFDTKLLSNRPPVGQSVLNFLEYMFNNFSKGLKMKSGTIWSPRYDDDFVTKTYHFVLIGVRDFGDILVSQMVRSWGVTGSLSILSPIISAYCSWEEKYVEWYKKAKIDLPIDLRSWDLSLKDIGIPKYDTAFYIEDQSLVRKVGAEVVKQLLDLTAKDQGVPNQYTLVYPRSRKKHLTKVFR
jgi:hypothetical protein